MDTIVVVLKSLSDKTRLRIMAVLRHAGSSLCVCEIVDTLKIPQYAVSRNMKELRHAGLVREQRAGRFVFYTLTMENNAIAKVVEASLAAMGSADMADDRKRLRSRLDQRKDPVCGSRPGGCCE
jgi:ArsR family transcriptional regulator